MNLIYICGLAQEPGPYDRTPWMKVFGAHDTRKRAEDWILMEVDESDVPGHRSDGDNKDEQGANIDQGENQHFTELVRRSFYFIQEKGINSPHSVTWRLMPDRTWEELDE